MARVKILQGYAQEQLKEIPTNKFASVVTSPPYNIGKEYGPGFNDALPWKDYVLNLEAVFYQVFRVMRMDGLLFVNIGDSHTDQMRGLKSHLVAAHLVKMGFHFVETVIWGKSITIPRKGQSPLAFGHYTPVKGKRLNSMFEYIFIFAKNKDEFVFNREALYVPHKDPSNAKRYNSKGRCLGDIWHIPYPTTGASKKKPYPCSFSVQLPRNCIKLSPPGPVLDPFCGGGATGIAALQEKRDVCLIDQNEEAVRVSRSRLKAFKNKLKLKGKK